MTIFLSRIYRVIFIGGWKRGYVVRTFKVSHVHLLNHSRDQKGKDEYIGI